MDNALYNEKYYEGIYNCDSEIKNFMKSIAEKLVAAYNPATVLDVGCSFGYLVEALRDLGVSAYGVDISAFAISHARQDIHPWLSCQSFLEPLPEHFPQKYDVVISIEVLEHLYEADGMRAIELMCGYTNGPIVISSTPYDFEDSTHFNVQQQEYWLKQFAKHNFTRDFYQTADFITSWAFCVHKASSDIVSLVENYERTMRIGELKQKNKALEKEVYTGMCYFQQNGVYSSECSTSFVFEKGYISITISVPQDCTAIRFDPVEHCGCIIKNLLVFSNMGPVHLKCQNGISCDDLYVFLTNDAQFELDCELAPINMLTIKCELYPLDHILLLDIVSNFIMQRTHSQKAYQTLKDECAKQLADKTVELEADRLSAAEKQSALLQDCERQLAEKEGILQQTEEKYLEKCEEIQDYQAIFESFEEDIQALREELSASQAECAEHLHEIQEYSNLVAYERTIYGNYQKERDCVLYSRSWKMTAPCRWIGRLVRKLIHNRLFRLIAKGFRCLKENGLNYTIKKFIAKLTGKTPPVEYTPVQCSTAAKSSKRTPPSGPPTDAIETVFNPTKMRRLNLVTDTLDGSSLLGGVATALLVATEFANKYDYELRIITRNSDCNSLNYFNTMEILDVEPAGKISFYSDFNRFQEDLPYKMEISSDDIFFATSWWSAEAIIKTSLREHFFYIIQEVETMFYNYGVDHHRCRSIMERQNVSFLINSHYLNDYFAKNCPNITDHGHYFEPAFPQKTYHCDPLVSKEKYNLFFYSRPNNPRNLFQLGVEILDNVIQKGILDTREWNIYFVGQDTPSVTFSNGYQAIQKGQLNWGEYATFLSTVDIGLCLMYTPHPSYPPFDVASSGGVVVSNKFENKQTFPVCDNVIMADLDNVSMEQAFVDAIALAKNQQQRTANYENNTILKNWSDAVAETVDFMNGEL